MSGPGAGGFDTSIGGGSLFSGSGSGGSAGRPSPLDGDHSGENAELQQFLQLEQQKQQLRATIQNLTDTCWEKCVSNPGSKLDSKTEACLENCVHRFFDVTVMIANRFATALQRQGGMELESEDRVMFGLHFRFRNPESNVKCQVTSTSVSWIYGMAQGLPS